MSRQAKRSRQRITGQESEGMLTDILGRLEEIQSCLETAESDQEACRRGIKAADEALKLTSDDPDVKSDIRMKRAQLLYIAAEKKYNTNSLVKDPVSSCIAECEQVCTIPNEILNKEAQKLIIRARQIQGTKKMDSNDVGESLKKFDPRKTRFTSLQSINTRLLQDIVTGYRQVKRVCRTCYYVSKRQEPLVHPNRCKHCNRNEIIRLIPASKMCKNELNLNVIPVPPAPPSFMAHPDKPFEHCKKDGHPKCFEYSATNEVWYSHSIDELVIWTIERHYGCSFDDYIKNYHGSKVSSPIPTQEMSDYVYQPDKVIFKNTSSIPRDLLRDVANSYEDRKEYCKWCFYRHAKIATPIVVAGGGKVCSSCQTNWEPVIVIKSNDRCWNFGDFNLLPVAPWPRSKPHATPFEYCQKEDHHRCFKVYSVDEFWYAHSVEELVVWTVEREYGMPFSDCIRRDLKALLKNPSSDPSSLGHTSLAHFRSLQPRTDEVVFIPSAANQVAPLNGTFHLLSCQFSRVSDIPQFLLQEVARSYQQKIVVCRMCFYGERRISSRKGTTCDFLEAHKWTNPLMVMPPSPLCDNTPCFALGEYITLPPPPPMAKLKPCPERNHRQCFVNCLGKQDERFAHSVESLVVWIVESENGSFEDFIAGLENQSIAAGSHVMHPRQAPSNIYFPENVLFANAKSIPRDLLADVARCYRDRRTVCRQCYFDKGRGQILSDRSPTVPHVCAGRGHVWKPLCVIPRSEMCAGPSDWVAIFPSPTHMKEVNTAFAMCNKKDGHRSCLEMARTENPWFPHTVEEMVIWTIERERDTPFGELYTEFLHDEPAYMYPKHDYYDNQSSENPSLSDNQYDDEYPPYHAEEDPYGDEYPPYHAEEDQSVQPPPPDPVSDVAEALRKLLSDWAGAELPALQEGEELSALQEGEELPAPQEGEELPAPQEVQVDSGSATTGFDGSQYELFPALLGQQLPTRVLTGGVTPSSSQPLLSQVDPNSTHMGGSPLPPSVSSPSLSQPDQLSSRGQTTHVGPQGSYPSVQLSLAGPVGTRQQGHLAIPHSEGSSGLGTTLHKVVEEEVFYSQDSQLDPFGGEGAEGRVLSQDHKSDLSSVASQSLIEDSPSLSTEQGTPHTDITTTAHVGGQAGSGETAEGLCTCLLCYQGFESAEELAEHCQDEDHVSAVQKDCCYATIWKYVPPPFDKTPSQFSMCPRSDVCRDRLNCRKAHSEDEFVEWGNRYQHRRRKTAGEQNPLSIVPQGEGVVLPANGDSEYGMKLMLSGQPLDVSVQSGKEFSWQITLEGQNWQTLLGIVCNCESKSVFNIARIEGDTFLPKQPKKPEWKPKSIEQAILLGKVSITLKAAVTTAGHHQCSVCFHLGFQQHFCLNLSVHVGPQQIQQTQFLQKAQPAQPQIQTAAPSLSGQPAVKDWAMHQQGVQRSHQVPTNDPPQTEQHQSPDQQPHLVASHPASFSSVVQSIPEPAVPRTAQCEAEDAKVESDAVTQNPHSETNATVVRAPESRVTPVGTHESTKGRVTPVGTQESTKGVSDSARAVPEETSPQLPRGATSSSSAKEQTKDTSTTEQPKSHKSLASGWAKGIGLVAEDDTLLKYTKDPFFDNLIASFVK
eukprot:Em0023g129a